MNGNGNPDSGKPCVENARLLQLYRQPPITAASIDGLAQALKLWRALVTQPVDDAAYTFSLEADGLSITDEAIGPDPFIDSGIYPYYETVADCALNFTIDGKPLADLLSRLKLYPDRETPAPELYRQWQAVKPQQQPPAETETYTCAVCSRSIKRLAGAGAPKHCPYCYGGTMHNIAALLEANAITPASIAELESALAKAGELITQPIAGTAFGLAVEAGAGVIVYDTIEADDYRREHYASIAEACNGFIIDGKPLAAYLGRLKLYPILILNGNG